MHQSLLVAPLEGAPRLAYFTPMELGEAALSGLDLLTPEELDVERWSRSGSGPAELLANVLSRALQLCEVAPGPIALAGLSPAGQIETACRQLAEEGWSYLTELQGL